MHRALCAAALAAAVAAGPAHVHAQAGRCPALRARRR